jgi:uncharacterized damage-inducible protein DinB
VTLAEAKVLLAYNVWANRRLLDAAGALPGLLCERDLGTSFGSVGGTLRHIAWGEWLWLGRWRETAPRGTDPRNADNLTALATRWAEIGREQLDFLSALRSPDLGRSVTYENPPGTPWTYPVAEMMRHVVNHSTYHRGQVASLMRQLGHTPEPTDYLVYFDDGMPGAAA